jgi:hypothetical protein
MMEQPPSPRGNGYVVSRNLNSHGGKADINWQARSAGSVENDPKPTSALNRRGRVIERGWRISVSVSTRRATPFSTFMSHDTNA